MRFQVFEVIDLAWELNASRSSGNEIHTKRPMMIVQAEWQITQFLDMTAVMCRRSDIDLDGWAA